MKTIILICLFNLCLQAQVVFSETFSSFYRTGYSIVIIPDTTLIHLTENDSIHLNQGTRGSSDFTVTGGSYSDLKGYSATGNPMRSGGTVIDFSGGNVYLERTGLNYTDSSFTIGFVLNIQAGKVFGFRDYDATAFGGAAGSNGWSVESRNSNTLLNFYYSNNSATTVSTTIGTQSSVNGWCIVVVRIDKAANNIYTYLNGIPVDTVDAATVTGATDGNPFRIGRLHQSGSYATTQDAYYFLDYGLMTNKSAREIGYLPPMWVSSNGNVTRDLLVPDFFITAWNDTLIVPLPDATLGNNQEWVLTLSNIDDVTAWIGSRSSAKSVKKTITGGASFTAKTTYFGDGFSLVGDSLVVVFPADTASIDNIVLSSETIQLPQAGKNDFGKPLSTGFPKPFK